MVFRKWCIDRCIQAFPWSRKVFFRLTRARLWSMSTLRRWCCAWCTAIASSWNPLQGRRHRWNHFLRSEWRFSRNQRLHFLSCLSWNRCLLNQNGFWLYYFGNKCGHCDIRTAQIEDGRLSQSSRAQHRSKFDLWWDSRFWNYKWLHDLQYAWLLALNGHLIYQRRSLLFDCCLMFLHKWFLICKSWIIQPVLLFPIWEYRLKPLMLFQFNQYLKLWNKAHLQRKCSFLNQFVWWTWIGCYNCSNYKADSHVTRIFQDLDVLLCFYLSQTFDPIPFG